MPVVEGLFVPNWPLARAERVVDFVALHDHVFQQRAAVERKAKPSAERAAHAYADLGVRPVLFLEELAAALERALLATASFGFRSAQSEIGALRKDRKAKAYAVPNPGRYAELAAQGIAGIQSLVQHRSRETAGAVGDRIASAPAIETDPLLRGAAVALEATRALHNHVLELVGETLNMGRTAGALALGSPPSYAMRSENLDKTTCEPCDVLHGSIYEMGSSDYFDNLPPEGCLGGGRCRGIMVFGDGPADVRAPDPTEEELAALRGRPGRKAA